MVNSGLISLDLDAITVNEDAKSAIIVVNRIGGSDGTVSANYSINNGTAKTGEDFTGNSETITFQPGETSKEIIIPILEDTISETDETFSLSIGNPVGTVLGDIRTAQTTILDNDNSKKATVAFSDVQYKISEDQNQASITVVRTGETDQAVSIDYATSDDYARETLDYVATSGTLTFEPGETSKTFTVAIQNDGLPEISESLDLILNNPDSIELGAKNTARLFIEDEDKSPFPYIHALLFDEEGKIDSVSPFAQGTAITQISMGPDSNIYFSSLSDGEISRIVYQGATSEFEPVKIVPIEDSETEETILEGMIYDASRSDNQNISTQLNQSVLDLGTDANFDNLVGFYEIVDIKGGIDINSDGVADLFPEDQGYAQAAITNRISNWELRAGSGGDPSKNTTAEQFSTVTIDGGKMYAPFVIANAGELGFEKFIAAENGEDDEQFNQAAKTIDDQVAYFAFVGANPDGAKHIEAYGNNVFGFEDLPANLGVSDNDFNDAVFEFNFSFL